MKIGKRTGAAHADRRKFQKREDLRTHGEDPGTTEGADGLDLTFQFRESSFRPFLCSVLWSFASFFTSLFWCSVRTFPGIQRVDLPRAARTHGGASGPEKKMAFKTTRPSLGSRRTSSVILRTWLPFPLSDASVKTGTDLRGRLHIYRPLQIWQRRFGWKPQVPQGPGPDASVICCLLPLSARGCIHGSSAGKSSSEVLFLLSFCLFTGRRRKVGRAPKPLGDARTQRNIQKVCKGTLHARGKEAPGRQSGSW